MTTDRIKIMYVIGSMGNGRAGTERNLLTIIEHLDRKLFEPYLVSLQDCDYIRQRQFVCDTACLHTYRMFTPAMWGQRRQLADRMRKLEIDVVQTFFVEGHLVGGRAARMASVRAIISSRRNLGYNYGLKQKLLLKIANRYPHRFLANSCAVADTISSIEGIDRRRFDVIYNGVELQTEYTAFSRGGLRSSDALAVVMVANLRPVKSVPTLIEAAAIVVKDFPQAQFIIVGDGPDRQSLIDLAERQALEHQITFTGSLTDISSTIRAATIGVLTSQSEGFSNAILEYMRAGLPVVASDVGGNREIVIDRKTGFLFPVGDARTLADRLTVLFKDPDLCRSMGIAGRERVEREFSLEAMILRHQEYYRRLLSV